MGFRDLQKFNQALLARQAWRLLDRPESLCAQIMKAKYYPNGELLDTSFPQLCSPCWRGIEHGLELLKKGVIWKIGDGKQINIWRSNWLPRDSGLKITGKRRSCRLKWVHQLWHVSNSNWNIQLLERVFWAHDVEVIRKLKIPSGQFTDVLAWHYGKNGVFTVRSAYRLAIQLRAQEMNDAANSAYAMGERPVWRTIWSLPIPQKVRIFIWRAVMQGLETRETNLNASLRFRILVSTKPRRVHHRISRM
jgi:hypothetical protein